MNNRLQAILSHVCLKTKEADLVIKNARVLDVFTGTDSLPVLVTTGAKEKWMQRDSFWHPDLLMPICIWNQLW